MLLERMLTARWLPPHPHPLGNLCLPNSKVYKYQDNDSGKNQNAYLCAINRLNPSLMSHAYRKDYLLVYTRSLGETVSGVKSVVSDLPVRFLRIDEHGMTYPNQRCSAPVAGSMFFPVRLSSNYDNYLTNFSYRVKEWVRNLSTTSPNPNVLTLTCRYDELGNSILARPDFAVSDYRLPLGLLTFAEMQRIYTIYTKPIGIQVFGVVLNTAFRDALQNVQFPAAACKLVGGAVNGRESLACMPTLTKTQITNLIRVGVAASVPGSRLPALPGAANLHACGGTNNSGAKAVTAKRVCRAVGVPDCQGSKPTTVASKSRYHEMPTASGVAECLSELNQGVDILGSSFTMSGTPKWAIGYQSTFNINFPEIFRNDNYTRQGGKYTTGQYRFIKVDGLEPTTLNAVWPKTHPYTDWEVALCYIKNRPLISISENKRLLIASICSQIKPDSYFTNSSGTLYSALLVLPVLFPPRLTKYAWGVAGFL